ncbi:hypothetical protein FHX42_000054 [Saccharopolyspora lacisalsi]|uniref:Uncharacterized protein n=1 Tax=Halosaccharopolyspora lacisalsi TaxID=1000566 RepID=A0A839DTX9_9PSEU|nr:hypothetical protein [Halosaccharopolyspora lacisalsi]MBA8822725.1 hypothetical protein [Halosaccharopolyspora lacisalsi]
MSVRSDNPPGDVPAEPTESIGSRSDASEGVASNRLGVAVTLAGIGALLTGLAVLFGLVRPAAPPVFTSWPLLLVLAALPPLSAAAFARAQRPVSAAALLVGPAALAVGRLVVDVQLVVDAGLAARPALLLPRTLTALTPSVGVWLLLAGHVVTVLAGVLAFGAVGGDHSASAGRVSAGATRRPGLLTAVLLVTIPTAAGFLVKSFASDDPYLVPKSAVEAPLPVLSGCLLLAVALPVASGFLVDLAAPAFARGGLLGLAFATAGVSVPPLSAALLVRDLSPSWGAVVGTVGAVLLGLLAVPAGRGNTRERLGEVRLPSLRGLLLSAALLSTLAGLLAAGGALLPQLHMPAGAPDVTPYSARMSAPAGAVLILLGAGLCHPRLAERVRPALAVGWVLVPLASAPTLETVLATTQATGAEVGFGAWASGLAVLPAALAGSVAAVAGGVERDEVDLTERSARRDLIVPAVLAALLALGAFSLPVMRAPGYTPPGVFTDFSTTSWGLVAALAAVLGAVGLAPVCRPRRVVALLSGAAAVVLLRVLELPLTAGRVADPVPGTGLWFGLGCVVLLGAAIGVVLRRDEPASDA